jgi:hypothetical protein
MGDAAVGLLVSHSQDPELTASPMQANAPPVLDRAQVDFE